MPRPKTGAVLEYVGADGTVYRSLRFTAYGKRHRLPLGPVSREAAERELRGIISSLRNGRDVPVTTGRERQQQRLRDQIGSPLRLVSFSPIPAVPLSR